MNSVFNVRAWLSTSILCGRSINSQNATSSPLNPVGSQLHPWEWRYSKAKTHSSQNCPCMLKDTTFSYISTNKCLQIDLLFLMISVQSNSLHSAIFIPQMIMNICEVLRALLKKSSKFPLGLQSRRGWEGFMVGASIVNSAYHPRSPYQRFTMFNRRKQVH